MKIKTKAKFKRKFKKQRLKLDKAVAAIQNINAKMEVLNSEIKLLAEIVEINAVAMSQSFKLIYVHTDETHPLRQSLKAANITWVESLKTASKSQIEAKKSEVKK